MKSVSPQFAATAASRSQKALAKIEVGRLMQTSSSTSASGFHKYFQPDYVITAPNIQSIEVSNSIGEDGKVDFGSCESASCSIAVRTSALQGDVYTAWFRPWYGFYVSSPDVRFDVVGDTLLISPEDAFTYSQSAGDGIITSNVEDFGGITRNYTGGYTLDNEAVEYVPMGVFGVDPESISGVFSFTSLTGYDRFYWDTTEFDQRERFYESAKKVFYSGLPSNPWVVTEQDRAETNRMLGSVIDELSSKFDVEIDLSNGISESKQSQTQSIQEMLATRGSTKYVRFGGSFRDCMSQLGQVLAGNFVMDGYGKASFKAPSENRCHVTKDMYSMDSLEVAATTSLLAQASMQVNVQGAFSGERPEGYEWTGSYAWPPTSVLRNPIGLYAVGYGENPTYLDYVDMLHNTLENEDYGGNTFYLVIETFARALLDSAGEMAEKSYSAWSDVYNTETDNDVRKLIPRIGYGNFVSDNTYSYKGFSLSMFGMPHVEVGDVVTVDLPMDAHSMVDDEYVTSVDVPVMSVVSTYNGAITTTIGATSAAFDMDKYTIRDNGFVTH